MHAHRPAARGFTMIELIVVLAITAMLFAMLVPAISAARHSAQVVECRNTLRNVGLAIHSYVEIHQVFPPTNQQTAWTVAILPFLDHQPLFNAYNHDFPFNASTNLPVGRQRLDVYSCPAEAESRLVPHGLVAGNAAMNVELSGLTPAAVTDGLSNTGLLVEISSNQAAAWSSGPSILFGPQSLPHQTVLNVVRADGSVIGISQDQLEQLGQFGSPSGGEVGAAATMP